MSEVHLTGLEGFNPLGFLAALGVQVLFADDPHPPRLWWTDDIIPHAVVDAHFDIDRIVDQALQVFPQWLDSPALNPKFGKDSDNTAKFSPPDLRKYLDNAFSDMPGNRFAAALVAEGSYDGKGTAAKPSDLYFSAGPVKFLQDVRKVLGEVDECQLRVGLQGPWPFDSDLPSFRWDVGDDPNWALAAEKPGVDKKTNPGPEALALLGLSRIPVFGSAKGTLTQGCSGSWRRGGAFTWPLWNQPASFNTVKSLLAQVSFPEQTGPTSGRDRSDWFQAWGVSYVLRSTIKRSDQGGYGNMSPPRKWLVGR